MRRSLAILEQSAPPPDENTRPGFKGSAAVVTLGCAKNHVDSEVMLGVLRRAGFDIVGEVDKADFAVVNTCGFLQSAVKESIDCILELGALKSSGRLRKLIVAGCVVQRYGPDLRKALPEVDHFIGVDDLLSVADVVESEAREVLELAGRPYFLYDDSLPRVLGTRAHTAYIKISEGCDRRCSFCIIPRLRGPMRSRTVDSILREARQLASAGVQELNLVGQDLTAFGSDRAEAAKAPAELIRLLRELDREGLVPWIRLLYAFPTGTSEELLEAIRELGSVCNYLDFPLQHVNEAVLRAMRRPLGRHSPRRLVNLIRARFPEIALRTTFIVGFPGETEEAVSELEEFVSEGHFSSVGVFAYSAEEGTPAARMEHGIGEKMKKARRDRIMRAQQKVVERRLAALVGQRVKVLVEGAHEESELLLCSRAEFQAPEIDGTVIINDMSGPGMPKAGSFGEVRISEVAGYDLVGTWLGDSSEQE